MRKKRNNKRKRNKEIKNNKAKDQENNKQYKEYLKSKEWQEKRNKALKRDNHRCQFCGTKSKSVRHKTHDNFPYESLSDLITLCKKCYNAYHEGLKIIEQRENERRKKKVFKICEENKNLTSQQLELLADELLGIKKKSKKQIVKMQAAKDKEYNNKKINNPYCL